MRQRIKVVQYNGRLTQISSFKTWWGGSVNAIKVGSSDYFCKHRKTYNKRNNIERKSA